MINTGDPDIELVQGKVAEAIDRAEGDAPPAEPKAQEEKQGNQTPVTGGSVGSLSEGYAANESEDLGERLLRLGHRPRR